MAADMHLSDVDLLTKRLEKLENRVFGKYGRDGENANIKVSECLSAINARINNAMTGRERTKSIFNRMDELERYLKPDLGTLCEDKTKLDIILTEEQYIYDTVAQLQRVQALKPILDSEHIKAVPSHVEKLTQLSRLQLKQEEDVGAYAENVKGLIDNYNTLIATLTQQFVQWDNLVTKLEMAAVPKKKL